MVDPPPKPKWISRSERVRRHKFEFLEYFRRLKLAEKATVAAKSIEIESDAVARPFSVLRSLKQIRSDFEPRRALVKKSTMSAAMTNDVLMMTCWVLNRDLPLEKTAVFLSKLAGERFGREWSVLCGHLDSAKLSHEPEYFAVLAFAGLHVAIFVGSACGDSIGMGSDGVVWEEEDDLADKATEQKSVVSQDDLDEKMAESGENRDLFE